jgi:hypothetical protein
MRRGELYLVLKPGHTDPRRQRVFVVVRRQLLIGWTRSTARWRLPGQIVSRNFMQVLATSNLLQAPVAHALVRAGSRLFSTLSRPRPRFLTPETFPRSLSKNSELLAVD